MISIVRNECECGGNCNRGSSDGAKNTDESEVIIHVSVDTDCDTVSTSSNMGGVTSSYSSGSETRPANMKVVYIIRIF